MYSQEQIRETKCQPIIRNSSEEIPPELDLSLLGVADLDAAVIEAEKRRTEIADHYTEICLDREPRIKEERANPKYKLNEISLIRYLVPIEPNDIRFKLLDYCLDVFDDQPFDIAASSRTENVVLYHNRWPELTTNSTFKLFARSPNSQAARMLFFKIYGIQFPKEEEVTIDTYTNYLKENFETIIGEYSRHYGRVIPPTERVYE